MRIGIIGTGSIATALVQGIAKDNHQITVSTRSEKNAKDLSNKYGNVTVSDNQTVIDNSDLIIIGLLAQHSAEVLGELQFKKTQNVISLMASASIEEVQALVTPARAAAIMIPFPSIAEGNSVVLALGDTALVHELVAHKNHVFNLNSSQELNSYLQAQALLAATAHMINTSAKWLGETTNDPEKAELFLRQLITSSLGNTNSDTLLNALSTPGGYNQRMREYIINNHIDTAVIDGLKKL